MNPATSHLHGFYVRRLIIHVYRCERPLWGYCVENVERQPFRDISDLQTVDDRSIAAVLASRGWQDFYLNIIVPAFFNTIGRKQTYKGMV